MSTLIQTCCIDDAGGIWLAIRQDATTVIARLVLDPFTITPVTTIADEVVAMTFHTVLWCASPRGQLWVYRDGAAPHKVAAMKRRVYALHAAGSQVIVVGEGGLRAHIEVQTGKRSSIDGGPTLYGVGGSGPVWAVGEEGVVLRHTLDGPASAWRADPTPTDCALYTAHLDPGSGLWVGGAGVLLHRVPQGWSFVDIPGSLHVHSVAAFGQRLWLGTMGAGLWASDGRRAAPMIHDTELHTVLALPSAALAFGPGHLAICRGPHWQVIALDAVWGQ